MSSRPRFWLALAALILFGRMFQTQVLWPEEGLPLAAAQQMIEGRALYRDIWFDKPPLLAWFYAGMLRLGGGSGYVLRLAGVLYILAVTILGYRLGRELWGMYEARWTAFFAAFFTAFYVHSATVPLAADLLLLLPHLGVFYFLATGRAWAAGLCAGLAFHLNTKALLVLAAAAVWGGARGWVALGGGFLLSTAVGLGLVGLSGGLADYIDQVWRWGGSYARAPFSDRPWLLGTERTLNWLGFHSALVIGAAAWFWGRPPERRRMGVWLALSFLGVAAGARFFPRYFFLVLPAVALAAGAGWEILSRRRRWTLAILAVALAVPAVRFGAVNLSLALRRQFAWRDVAIDADSRRAAAHVVRLTKPTDRIFIWGFRPEIYFYARRPAASRFLESQPLTGVLADRHLERSDPFLPERAAHHRLELEEELRARPPVVIVDGLGPYNPRLAMENFAELKAVLEGYHLVEQTAGSRLYARRTTP